MPTVVRRTVQVLLHSVLHCVAGKQWGGIANEQWCAEPHGEASDGAAAWPFSTASRGLESVARGRMPLGPLAQEAVPGPTAVGLTKSEQ